MNKFFSFSLLSVFTITSIIAQPQYICFRAQEPITIDGEIDDIQWANASWSDDFVDIRGKDYPIKPKYPTRVKMLWDDQFLYVAAELVEPHIWATLTQRDTVIYHDNDFEVFIDTKGNRHNYYELEINALGTQWDLMMTKPYKEGGTYINGFDIKELRTKVKIYGTLNNPSDTDKKWTVEMAIPFKSLVNHQIKAGDIWRMNFSRVEWLKTAIENGRYKKLKGKEGFGAEENWVWAPTGIVDIHIPQKWGLVTFSEK